jgi:hypothetical protein
VDGGDPRDTFALFYKAVFAMNDIGCPFYYFSGIVASHAVMARERAKSHVPQAPPSWRLAADAPRSAFVV